MKKFKCFSTIHYDQTVNSLKNITFDRLLIICDPFFAENQVISEIVKSVGSKKVKMITEVFPDPSLDIIANGVEICVDFKPDVIIALGGGSAIDQAKAIKLFSYKITNIDSKLIVIPTTSGTASEVTSFSVVTDTVNKKKIPLIDDYMLPDLAILDYELIYDMPKEIVANTGIDALTHGLESYMSINASSISDALAIQAIKLLFNNLEDSYLRKNNVDAKKAVHDASTMAGISFNNASLGINHAIAHQIGAIHKLPHGLTNAILLTHVIELNAKDKATKAKLNQLAYELHLTTNVNINGYKVLINKIKSILTKFGIKTCFKTYIDKQQYALHVDEVAKNALNDACYATTPFKLNHEKLAKFIKGLYNGN